MQPSSDERLSIKKNDSRLSDSTHNTGKIDQ